ncbi:MAG: LysM peptidoglycan-binding domain-containing protein [Rhizobiaceae bacterium]
MLNFAKFSSGLTVVAATGFLIGAMLTDNGGQVVRNETAFKQEAEKASVVASTNGSNDGPEVTEIDRIITASVQRVKRSEGGRLSVDDLLIAERINAATYAGAKKVIKVSSVKTSTSSITVQPGDTLYAIGLKHGLTISEIASLNGMSDPYVVRVGQKLRIN